jgi:hypothetical protein
MRTPAPDLAVTRPGSEHADDLPLCATTGLPSAPVATPLTVGHDPFIVWGLNTASCPT